jgi:hypothetical protein
MAMNHSELPSACLKTGSSNMRVMFSIPIHSGADSAS